LDLLQNTWAWNLFSSSQLGVPAGLAFTNRLSTSVGVNAAGLTNPPAAPAGSVLASDTGELRWDLSRASQGLVTLDTTRTKALIGFADNRPVTLGSLTFRPGTTQLGWCTLGITLTRGEVFTNDCTALVVASGWWENTGQVWTDTNRTSVGNQWGQSPVLTEVVPFTLTLPVGTNYVQVWSLDERGQRKAALPVTGTSTSTTITITSNANSTWYEVAVARWVASFDLWRARYFTADEQANPAVSAEAAIPDGDGVPNLLKYYLGLPGRAPAPAGSPPGGSLLPLSGQLYLALSYNHDKLVKDVNCVAQVSPNLANWFSGTGYARLEQTLDLGSLERLTMRDLTPVGGTPEHFMRLWLAR
jgi:hypothetical protein